MHIRKIHSIRRYLHVGVLMMAKHRWQNRAKRSISENIEQDARKRKIHIFNVKFFVDLSAPL